MNNKHTLFYLLATPLAVFLFLAALTACSNETGSPDDGTDDGQPVPVRITFASESNEIVTFDIYILNDKNEVEKHLDKTAFTFTQTLYTSSEDIELSPGTKKVYAFANCEGDAFSDLSLGTDWPSIPNAVTSNAAFDALTGISADKGIPMSADTTWNVTQTTTTCTVSLIRMVAQMNINVIEQQTGKNTQSIQSLSIADLLPETTNLFRQGYGEVSLPQSVNKKSWEVENTNIPTGNSPISFYLHETSGQFKVSIKIDGESSTRTTTFTKVIPRNYIIPLIIHITDYSLEITGSYELAAIGTVAVKTNIGNGYTIELPEGASNIEITVKLKSKNGYVTKDVTWSQTPEKVAGLTFSNGSEASYLIKGQVPANIGEYPVTLFATLNGTGGENTLSFNLTFAVRPLNNSDLSTTTKAVPSSPSGQVEPIIIEL